MTEATAGARSDRVEVAMPRLSEGMEEGTLLRWLVGDGATVEAGQPIAEIETDKAAMEYEAAVAGVLSHGVDEGDTVPVGALIAVIGRTHEAHQALEPRRTRASPLARRIAAEHGIDVSGLVGNGPAGRVVRADVLAVIDRGTPSGPAGADRDPAGSRADTVRIEPSRLQLTIARRMAQAKASIPDFAISSAVDMDAAVALRAQMAAHAARLGGQAPSYNDMVVKACGIALREHPMANGMWAEDAFHLHGRVNVGVAVAARDALVVPTIFDADTASLSSIGAQARRLAAGAREGTLTPAELDGGTFTVSNLGMYGVSDFVAVVNPPQAAILAVGQLARQPIVVDDELGIGHRMTVTLSCDHRILYGAAAAGFLARVRELLENPWSLVL